MGWFRIISGLLGLVALGIYAHSNPPAESIEKILSQPENYFGKHVTLYVETRIDSVKHGAFRINERGHTIWVKGEIEKSAIGESLSLDGIVKPDTTLQLNEIHIATNRIHKMWTSAVAVLALAFVIIDVISWRRTGLQVNHNA